MDQNVPGHKTKVLYNWGPSIDRAHPAAVPVQGRRASLMTTTTDNQGSMTQTVIWIGAMLVIVVALAYFAV